MPRRVSRRGALALAGAAALTGCGANPPHRTETVKSSAGSLTVPSGADAWPSEGAGGRNSYTNPDARGPADGVETANRFGGFESVSLSAVVDRVGYGAIDGRVAAFSFTDGSIRWRGPKAQYDPPVTVTERFVFSASGAALDRETGERSWQPPNPENGWGFDGSAGVGVVDGTVVGINGNAANSLGDGGNRRWRTEWKDGANARQTGTVSAVFDDSRAIRVGTTRALGEDIGARDYEHSRVTALDASGNELFQFQTAGNIASRGIAALPALNGGVLYLPTAVWNSSEDEAGSDGQFNVTLGQVYTLDAETGEIYRRIQYEGAQPTGMAFIDGDPVVATNDGRVDRWWKSGPADDGWTTEFDHTPGRIAAGNGALYVLGDTDTESFVDCLDGETGERQWRRELAIDTDTSWLALCGNSLYLTGHGGTLLELRG